MRQWLLSVLLMRLVCFVNFVYIVWYCLKTYLLRTVCVPLCVECLRHLRKTCISSLGPDFRKILRQCYENLRNFVLCTPIVRQIYDNANFRKIL